MKVKITGRHMDVGASFTEHVHSHLPSLSSKFFSHPLESHVTLSKQKDGSFHADIILHAGRGLYIHSEHHGENPYMAFDGALHKMEERLRRHKGRLKNHHKGGQHETPSLRTAYYVMESPAFQEEAYPQAESESAVIAEMESHIASLSVAEAVAQLDLSGKPALLFCNSSHGGLNMVYRRGDGHIGWVDPQGHVQALPN